MIAHSWENLCRNSGFQQRSSSTTLEQNIQVWMYWRRQKKQFDFTCITLPRQYNSEPRENFLPCDLSNGRKWQHLNKHPVSPPVQDAAKEAHLSSAPSRLLNHVLHKCGTRKGRERGRWDSQSIKRRQIPLTASWIPSKDYPCATGNALLTVPPQWPSVCLTHTYPHCIAGSLYPLLVAALK